MSAPSEKLSEWHTELGEAWRDAQTLLFDTGLSDQQRRQVQAVLDRLERVRAEMRAAARSAPVS